MIQKIKDFIKSIRPEGGWLYNKKLLMAMSLLASVACWVFLTLYVNADSQKTVTDVPVRIDTAALEDYGLEMIAITAPADLTDGKLDVNVVGSAYQISQITAEDLSVVAQVGSVNKAGEYNLSMVLSSNNKSVTTSLKDGNKTIKVWFDSIKEKSITLEKPVVTGVSVPPESGYIIGDPTGFVKTITISGPESVIETITGARLQAELNAELSSTTTVEGVICYLDSSGEVIDTERVQYVSIVDYNDLGNVEGVPAGAPAPTDCVISVPIRTECVLKLVPEFKNVPAGFDVDALKYSLSQKTIRLEGDIDVMKKYIEEGVLTLDGIDLSTLTPSNKKFVIKLNLSSAVTAIDGETEITVTFDMSGYRQETFTVSGNSIVLRNVSGHNVSVASDSLDITVVGTAKMLDRLKAQDFTVIVDMFDDEWNPGVREKTAAVILNSSKCWSVGTYTVKVKVE